MDAADIPPSLRPFVRFTPARRRQVILPLAAALDTDEDFRSAVAEGVREALPDLASALEAGQPLPSADPDDVAAVAYLLRTPGWEDVIAAAGGSEAAASAGAGGGGGPRRAAQATRSGRGQ